jgi:hypothetical protein
MAACTKLLTVVAKLTLSMGLGKTSFMPAYKHSCRSWAWVLAVKPTTGIWQMGSRNW